MVTPAKAGEYRTLVVVSEGAVDWVTLNRPANLNAIDNQMLLELWTYFTEKQSDRRCRIIVLQGEGKAFCAGLDLKAAGEATPPDQGDERARSEASLSAIVRLMRSSPQPVISLVNGAACGGGFVLALASDIRLAGRSARMNVAFVKLGLSGCELGVSYFLPRMVGLSVARELMMTGRFINADRALATGLVSEVVDDEELPKAARKLIAEMLQTSPSGLRRTKETLELALGVDSLEAVMRLEEHTQLLCLRSPDFAEARSAFLEKRQPVFVG